MNGGLVYSSDKGRMCPRCERPLVGCVCKRMQQAAPAGDGIVRVRCDTKGRKGKGVTLIEGVPLGLDELKAFAKKLKKKCGSGGSIKDGTIEIQGDHVALMLTELAKEGWTVRRSGG